MLNLNGKTTVYGIIGAPVNHSLSPLFQNYFIKTSKLNAAYLPFHVEPRTLSEALNGLHAAHVQGLNITVPHKEQSIPFVNADSDALIIGAINTVKRLDSGWSATNTDWQGFASVLEGLQANISGSSVLIFGAGGTSRAVCHALYQKGATEIIICNRTPDRAKKLASGLRQSYPSIQVNLLNWDSSAVCTKAQQCNIIINTSAIGLHEEDTFPFELQGSGVAVDVVYKPSGETAFGLAAKKGGFNAIDGLPMLIAQGVASFRFWHSKGIEKNSFDLPDKLQSLHWVEKQLARQPLNLSGWRT